MADMYLFPAEALAILRQTKWDPHAKDHFDGLAGGLVWDDEFPIDATRACTSVDSWAFRVIIAYRASLIEETPREELRPTWDQLLRECPDWPGFRPERQSAELKDRLNRKSARFMRSLDVLKRFCSQSGSDDEPSPQA